jgi:hypothetical protein
MEWTILRNNFIETCLLIVQIPYKIYQRSKLQKKQGYNFYFGLYWLKKLQLPYQPYHPLTIMKHIVVKSLYGYA